MPSEEKAKVSQPNYVLLLIPENKILSHIKTSKIRTHILLNYKGHSMKLKWFDVIKKMKLHSEKISGWQGHELGDRSQQSTEGFSVMSLIMYDDATELDTSSYTCSNP